MTPQPVTKSRSLGRVLTAEQTDVVDTMQTGKNFVVNAGAGTGKTHTLVEAANAVDGDGLYTAFNKDIIEDGKGKFRRGVQCQPEGTMVRVPVNIGLNHFTYREVPIESLRVGDEVVSWQTENAAGGMIRKRGRKITGVAQRPYNGELITVTSDGAHEPLHAGTPVCGTAERCLRR